MIISLAALPLLIGVPIGIYSAVSQYSRFDYTFYDHCPLSVSHADLFLWAAADPDFFGHACPSQGSRPLDPTSTAGLRVAVRPYEIASWLPKIEPSSLLDQALCICSCL